MNFRFLFLGIVLAFVFLAGLASAASDIELKHKEITLYSGGYAFVLREATVENSGAYDFKAQNFSFVPSGRPFFINDAGGAASNWKLYNEKVTRLVERQKTLQELLNESIGKKVSVTSKNENISGTLAWFDEAQIAVSNTLGWKIFSFFTIENFMLPSSAGKTSDRVDTQEYGLEIMGNGKGKRNLGVGYLTSATQWSQSYVFRIDAESEKGEGNIESWAAVGNFEQETWNKTTLYFIIGDPHFASFVRPYYDYYAYSAKDASRMMAGVSETLGVSPPPAAPSVQWQALTGYWKYKVEPVTLKSGEQGSYQLFKRHAPYERKFVWDSDYAYSDSFSRARKIFAINNTGSELWGAGVLEVFEKNSLLGEDSIDYTPGKGGVEIYVSDIADLKGKKEYISSNSYDNGNDRVSETAYRITIENRMAGDSKLTVRDRVSEGSAGINVDIITSSKYSKKPNGVMEWVQTAASGKTIQIDYTVRVTEVGYYKKYQK